MLDEVGAAATGRVGVICLRVASCHDWFIAVERECGAVIAETRLPPGTMDRVLSEYISRVVAAGHLHAVPILV
ncbi:MAG: hypothetical protein HYV09_40815 [Deltaproteobacteria bacterium]|nr:hypothetical protein [Deltaproteobacteria bacterium]